MRAESQHWNVTEMMLPPACSECLKLTNTHLIQPDILSVTVALIIRIAGKPSLDAFDVRGIVLRPAVDELSKRDGFRASFERRRVHVAVFARSVAKINPYIAFATDDPERRFKSGSTHERELQLRLPGKEALKFDFAIDACWLPEK